MTTETTCLSSIWQTDDKIKQYLNCMAVRRHTAFEPGDVAYYDGAVVIDPPK